MEDSHKKKCEELKWQGCVDSLLNEWREWIEIYIYIAHFVYTVSLMTEEFIADFASTDALGNEVE